MDALNIVTLIVAILGLVVAVASLSWNVALFKLQGPRPKLTPVVGVLGLGGAITGPAEPKMLSSLQASLADHPGPSVIGAQVVNGGRMPLHVQRWSLGAVGTKTEYVPLESIGNRQMPTTIEPGASETFLVEGRNAQLLLQTSEKLTGRSDAIVCTVNSGAKRYRSAKISRDLILSLRDCPRAADTL